MDSAKNVAGPGRPAGRCARAFLAASAWIDRGLTWGMDPVIREDVLSERHADRCDHLADEDASLGAVASRAARSALGDSVHRILGDDPTAAPAAGLSFLIGFGALWLSIASNFPPMNRFFDGVIAVGFLGTGFVMMRRPRELERTRLLPCLVVASVGLAGGALSLPISAATEVFDVLTKAALGSAAVGFAIVAAALVPAHVNRVWFARGGALLWVSALVLAAGEIGWAFTGVDLTPATGASLVIAVGCVVVAAILGRLRHIPIRP